MRMSSGSKPMVAADTAVCSFTKPGSLEDLNRRVIACERCPRLRVYCRKIAETKRRAYIKEEYWGRPVPSFGDPQARVLILGLAPGAHGSNRTGRPFTGDGSGAFLWPVLYEAGYASQPCSLSRGDGMRLTDAWIAAAVRCAPPDNKPAREELARCAPYLDEEVAALTQLRVIVALGKIAFDSYLAHLARTGVRQAGAVFAHGAQYRVADHRTLLATYHPSLQNTNTGRLTRAMFLDIFRRARLLAEG